MWFPMSMLMEPKVPAEGKLYYQGYNVKDLVKITRVAWFAF